MGCFPDSFSQGKPSCAGQTSTLLALLLSAGCIGSLAFEWFTGPSPTSVEISDLSEEVHSLKVKCNSLLGCYATYSAHGACTTKLPLQKTMYIRRGDQYDVQLCNSPTASWTDGVYLSGIYDLSTLQAVSRIASTLLATSVVVNASASVRVGATSRRRAQGLSVTPATTLSGVATTLSTTLSGVATSQPLLQSTLATLPNLAPPLEFARPGGKWEPFPFVAAPSLKYTAVELTREVECTQKPQLYGLLPTMDEDCNTERYSAGKTSLTSVDCAVPNAATTGAVGQASAVCYLLTLNRLQKALVSLPRITLYGAVAEVGGVEYFVLVIGWLVFVFLQFSCCSTDEPNEEQGPESKQLNVSVSLQSIRLNNNEPDTLYRQGTKCTPDVGKSLSIPIELDLATEEYYEQGNQQNKQTGKRAPDTRGNFIQKNALQKKAIHYPLALSY